ncbi:uncharacterized protein BJ171DRAFT_529460 [Polychytrium aggregatum]|uniref:uncharacterized protein n=1 Tax=Polychytrium aggregatum TaxID=110093 RepID=UPI0022FE1644|nr:uncharacterized protein BJ171DRAFT_529460 [Polychytrium aggregatum]KAI9193264.1 hypothetical protein BJ171DRAFT_529460 [Polychytrium aggregatum]
MPRTSSSRRGSRKAPPASQEPQHLSQSQSKSQASIKSFLHTHDDSTARRPRRTRANQPPDDSDAFHPVAGARPLPSTEDYELHRVLELSRKEFQAQQSRLLVAAKPQHIQHIPQIPQTREKPPAVPAPRPFAALGSPPRVFRVTDVDDIIIDSDDDSSTAVTAALTTKQLRKSRTSAATNASSTKDTARSPAPAALAPASTRKTRSAARATRICIEATQDHSENPDRVSSTIIPATLDAGPRPTAGSVPARTSLRRRSAPAQGQRSPRAIGVADPISDSDDDAVAARALELRRISTPLKLVSSNSYPTPSSRRPKATSEFGSRRTPTTGSSPKSDSLKSPTLSRSASMPMDRASLAEPTVAQTQVHRQHRHAFGFIPHAAASLGTTPSKDLSPNTSSHTQPSQQLLLTAVPSNSDIRAPDASFALLDLEDPQSLPSPYSLELNTGGSVALAQLSHAQSTKHAVTDESESDVADDDVLVELMLKPSRKRVRLVPSPDDNEKDAILDKSESHELSFRSARACSAKTPIPAGQVQKQSGSRADSLDWNPKYAFSSKPLLCVQNSMGSSCADEDSDAGDSFQLADLICAPDGSRCGGSSVDKNSDAAQSSQIASCMYIPETLYPESPVSDAMSDYRSGISDSAFLTTDSHPRPSNKRLDSLVDEMDIPCGQDGGVDSEMHGSLPPHLLVMETLADDMNYEDDGDESPNIIESTSKPPNPPTVNAQSQNALGSTLVDTLNVRQSLALTADQHSGCESVGKDHDKGYDSPCPNSLPAEQSFHSVRPTDGPSLQHTSGLGHLAAETLVDVAIDGPDNEDANPYPNSSTLIDSLSTDKVDEVGRHSISDDNNHAHQSDNSSDEGEPSSSLNIVSAFVPSQDLVVTHIGTESEKTVEDTAASQLMIPTSYVPATRPSSLPKAGTSKPARPWTVLSGAIPQSPAPFVIHLSDDEGNEAPFARRPKPRSLNAIITISDDEETLPDAQATVGYASDGSVPSLARSLSGRRRRVIVDESDDDGEKPPQCQPKRPVLQPQPPAEVSDGLADDITEFSTGRLTAVPSSVPRAAPRRQLPAQPPLGPEANHVPRRPLRMQPTVIDDVEDGQSFEGAPGGEVGRNAYNSRRVNAGPSFSPSLMHNGDGNDGDDGDDGTLESQDDDFSPSIEYSLQPSAGMILERPEGFVNLKELQRQTGSLGEYAGYLDQFNLSSKKPSVSTSPRTRTRKRSAPVASPSSSSRSRGTSRKGAGRRRFTKSRKSSNSGVGGGSGSSGSGRRVRAMTLSSGPVSQDLITPRSQPAAKYHNYYKSAPDVDSFAHFGGGMGWEGIGRQGI